MTVSNQGKGYVRILCAILFAVFSILYLYFYQADLMALTQHVCSAGQTSYNRTVGAILITFILMMLQFGVKRFFQKSDALYALSYAPSLLLLTALTSIRESAGGFSFGVWGYVLPVLLLLFAAFMLVMRKISYDTRSMHKYDVPTLVLSNSATFLVMFLLTCLFGNSSTRLHKQLEAERFISTADYDGAIAAIRSYDRPDSAMCTLAIYALSQKGELADKLFTFPLTGGQDVMLPAATTLKLLPYGRIYNYVGVLTKQTMPASKYLDYLLRHNLGNKPFADYYLCSLLLSKQIDKFVSYIGHFYNINGPLPTHYREALLLYTHLRSNPKIIFKNNIMEADFQDFQTLESKPGNATGRRNQLKDVYGNTYWFYYFYNKQ